MRRLLLLAAVTLTAAAPAAAVAGPTAAKVPNGTYKGRIAHQGYEITFKVKAGKVTDLVARMLQDCGSGLETFLIAPSSSWAIKGSRVTGKKVETVGQAAAHVTLQGTFQGTTFRGFVREWDTVEGSGIVCDTLKRTFTAKRVR